MSLERRVRAGLERMAADLEPDVEWRLEATLRSARRAATRRQLSGAMAFAVVILVVLAGPSLIDALRNRSVGVGGAPSPTAAILLTGTYSIALFPSDVNVTSNQMLGAWRIGFESNQILTVSAPPAFTGKSSGYTFEIVGPQFRTDLLGQDVCSSVPPGTYRWSLDGEQLTFVVVDDSCSGRVALLTAGEWSAVTSR